MKSKSFIAALLFVSTLGLTTSCADMFDVDSTRVVYEKDHDLGSTSDSVYTTLGVLQCMRQIADRYVILGEVRGDMCEINENTKTSLRNLANFKYSKNDTAFNESNEYLCARDYYAVINNCSYALAKMDTTLTINNSRVMTDEFAALLGIRAWTYLQLAINYGEVPYYDYRELTTTLADFEKVGAKRLNIYQLADELIPQLAPYVDYTMPSFVNEIPKNVYPVLRLVVADLCLWSGRYAEAAAYYEEYLFENKNFQTTAGDVAFYDMLKPGALMSWNGKTGKSSSVSCLEKDNNLYPSTNVSGNGYENLAYIMMETDPTKGIASELGSLFFSTDNTHALNPSTLWTELSAAQVVFSAEKEEKTGKLEKLKLSTSVGDMRASKNLYMSSGSVDDRSFDYYTKFGRGYTPTINLYRRSVVYLRYAEALNALAHQANKAQTADSLSRVYAKNAFYLLKDVSQIVYPKALALVEVGDTASYNKLERNKYKIQAEFVGIHARGAGDVAYDETYYVLKPEVIAARLGKDGTSLNFGDTIQYIDELIIDELALESTLEGNRFGDLIRFADRRGEPEFLAKRVAGRKGQGKHDPALEEKLMNRDYWYLPLK